MEKLCSYAGPAQVIYSNLIKLKILHFFISKILNKNLLRYFIFDLRSFIIYILSMKIHLFLFYWISLCMLFFAASCNSDAEKSRVMAKGVKFPFNTPSEIAEPKLSSLIYNLPIDHTAGVAITQGPLNLNVDSSHGYLCCLYAIDFATCLAQENQTEIYPGKIVAARKGIVIALHDEGIADGAFYNIDLSADGFGNWIAIEHELNEISFYAHLNEIKVSIGKRVESGQEIGIEGSTGNAGCRHLHFSVHRLIGKKSLNICPFDTTQYQSIPYKLQYYNQSNNQLQITDIRIFAGINRANDARFYSLLQ